eukprot:3596928-Pleurochrysis_carterae.AAC.1
MRQDGTDESEKCVKVELMRAKNASKMRQCWSDVRRDAYSRRSSNIDDVAQRWGKRGSGGRADEERGRARTGKVLWEKGRERELGGKTRGWRLGSGKNGGRADAASAVWGWVECSSGTRRVEGGRGLWRREPAVKVERLAGKRKVRRTHERWKAGG